MDFTHFDSQGKAVMVDITQKQATKRIARASAIVAMKKETLQLIKSGGIKKGDVLAVANTAGIAAAKNTYQSILMCHNIPLAYCRLNFDFFSETRLHISAETCAYAQTGVEMEALSAVCAAALNLYDMCKSVDKNMCIEQVQLDYKTGGKSGTYVRSEQ